MTLKSKDLGSEQHAITTYKDWGDKASVILIGTRGEAECLSSYFDHTYSSQ